VGETMLAEGAVFSAGGGGGGWGLSLPQPASATSASIRWMRRGMARLYWNITFEPDLKQ
jgi:hypothetical protein